MQDGRLHHYVTLRRRRKEQHDTAGATARTTNYGTLQDLFAKPTDRQQQLIQTERDLADGCRKEEEVIVDTVGGGSLTAAMFGIIKGTVGPAILYLPRGFQQSGYIVAITCMIVATCAYLYSALRLLQCWKIEHEKVLRLEEVKALLLSPDEGDNDDKVTRKDQNAVLLTYPELARRAFSSYSIICQIGIASMQFGVCLTYLIFVPQNLVESFENLVDMDVSKVAFLILMVLVEVPLCWIQDIRKLTPTNVLATILIACGLFSCLWIALSIMALDASTSIWDQLSNLPPSNSDTWYLFIGTSFFVFEGSITLLVPLQEAICTTQDQAKFPKLNQNVTSWIVVFYIFFAMICWASMGESVKTAFTASLPPGTMTTCVQLAYSVAVVLTFPLQAFPAMQVVFQNIHVKSTLQRNVVASILTCALGLLAYVSIDYLGNVVSLLGSLVGIPIALIFPPMMHSQLCKPTLWQWWMNCGVAGIGVFAMCATSFTTVVLWDKGAE